MRLLDWKSDGHQHVAAFTGTDDSAVADGDFA
jgi:hypothetical protein